MCLKKLKCLIVYSFKCQDLEFRYNGEFGCGVVLAHALTLFSPIHEQKKVNPDCSMNLSDGQMHDNESINFAAKENIASK